MEMPLVWVDLVVEEMLEEDLVLEQVHWALLVKETLAVQVIQIRLPMDLAAEVPATQVVMVDLDPGTEVLEQIHLSQDQL